jgi:tetratricopeptide (TPR) repeat protein
MTPRIALLAAMVLAVALLAGGCAAVATSVALSSGPELIAATMRQYGFRSEFEEAVPLMKKRDWLGLSTLARQHLEREPNRGEWWQLAGYGHLQAGELLVARDCFARVTRLLPEEVSGWNLYAYALWKTGDARAALFTLERAVQTDPASTVAWVLTGDLQAANGRLREAVRAYDTALEIDKRDIFAWYGLGMLARRGGDAAGVERAVRSLKQLYPPFADELAKQPG